MAGSFTQPVDANAVLCALENGEVLHLFLDEHTLLDSRFRPMREATQLALPLKGPLNDDIAALFSALPFSTELATRHFESSEPSNNPHAQLHRTIKTWLDTNADDEEKTALLTQLPRKWERLGDAMVLPEQAFQTPQWTHLLSRCSQQQIEMLWQNVAQALSANRLGRQHAVASDMFRTSQTELLYGDNGWVEFLDHGVRFGFDFTRVMFSSGNNTERRRIGAISMKGEVVVDAFAGIGYYTLHMAKRSQAEHIHAFEMNPDAIEGLQWGIRANDVEQRVTVHSGDNQRNLPLLYGKADRCHLGLLPSSEAVWEHAVRCLKAHGGWLHIHMNVRENEIDTWQASTVDTLKHIAAEHGRTWNFSSTHLERVKWYSPRVRHVVLDVHFEDIHGMNNV